MEIRSPKSDGHSEKSQEPGVQDEALAQAKHGAGESSAGLERKNHCGLTSLCEDHSGSCLISGYSLVGDTVR